MAAAVVGGTAHHMGKKSAQAQAAEAQQNAAIEDLQQQQAQPQYAPAPPAPAYAPAAAPAPAAASSDDKFDQLTKLKQLLDQGILTQAEFDVEKMKVLQGL
jgi:hypothetical protein